jgi:hypothetical protein
MKFHLRSISAILFCIGIVLPINTRASQIASAPISPLTIAVSTMSNQYKIDSPILVVVTLTNTSSEPVRLINFRIADAAYRRLSWEYSLNTRWSRCRKDCILQSYPGRISPRRTGHPFRWEFRPIYDDSRTGRSHNNRCQKVI